MKAVLWTVGLLALTSAARAQSNQSPLVPPVANAKNPAGVVTLKVGDKAPAFTLPNGDGKSVSLAEFTAKLPVVIVFYRGFW